MARSVLLFALCLLPALAVAHRPLVRPYLVQGKVFCDSCLAGFETPASTFIAGAKVKIECKDRTTGVTKYTKEATTDSSGCYKMYVNEDHDNDVCNVIAVKSPQVDCSVPLEGREIARVILTSYNGMASDNRFVNNVGFTKTKPDAGCEKVMLQYQDNEEQY